MNMIKQTLDTRGLTGIAPAMRAQYTLSRLDCGEVMMVTTTESEAVQRLDAFCQQQGTELLQRVEWNGEFTFLVRKDCSHSH